MPGDVNPFEPWRPPPESRSPQPWRPPRRPDPEPEPPREAPAEWPARQPGLTGGQQAVVWLTIAGLVGGMIALGDLGGGHSSRVGAAGLLAWLGLLAGLALARRRRWPARLAWVAAGGGAALAAWYFVPTTGGVNLLQAERVLSAARGL